MKILAYIMNGFLIFMCLLALLGEVTEPSVDSGVVWFMMVLLFITSVVNICVIAKKE